MGVHLERAEILMAQSRYEMAAQELQQELAVDPDSAQAYAWLGWCLRFLKKYEEAIKEAEQAIKLAPDWEDGYYVLGWILCDRNQLLEAENVTKEAIRLNPENANHFILLSNIRVKQKRWQEALEAATQGLNIEPENADCLNNKGIALFELGRTEEAIATTKQAIALDPENFSNYNNLGWMILNREGSPTKAWEYFRQALRLNPNFESAQDGLIQAIKLKNPLYRLVYRCLIFPYRRLQLGRFLSGKALLGFFACLCLGFRILLNLAATNPNPLIWLALIVLFWLIFLPWFVDLFITLLLQLKFKQSYWLTTLVWAILSAFYLWLMTGNSKTLFAPVLFGLLLLPVSATFRSSAGWHSSLMVGYTTIMALVGLAGLVLPLPGLPFVSVDVWFWLTWLIVLAFGTLFSFFFIWRSSPKLR